MAYKSPLILGRPFLKTARTKIDVYAGTLSMEIGDTVVQFSLFDAMKHPREDHSILSIDVLDGLLDIDLSADRILFDDLKDSLTTETGMTERDADLFLVEDEQVSVGDCIEPQGPPLLIDVSEIPNGRYLSVGDCTEPQVPPIPAEQEQLELKPVTPALTQSLDGRYSSSFIHSYISIPHTITTKLRNGNIKVITWE